MYAQIFLSYGKDEVNSGESGRRSYRIRRDCLAQLGVVVFLDSTQGRSLAEAFAREGYNAHPDLELDELD